MTDDDARALAIGRLILRLDAEAAARGPGFTGPDASLARILADTVAPLVRARVGPMSADAVQEAARRLAPPGSG